MNNPDQIDYLPEELEEASGLTDVSLTEVAMVQDELGIIFLYDIPGRKVIRKIPFGPRGDYEGITRVNDVMFVLESQGELFEIQDWMGKPKVTKRKLPLPTADNEGLCFDPVENTILVAPKSRWKKGRKEKSKRPIFSVDINSGHMNPDPILVLDTKDIIDFAVANNLDVPRKKSKKGEDHIFLSFKPASVAVHPVTNDFFVLSAAGNVLASFNRRGEVTGFQMLNRQLFPQPEGMTFLPDASLVIVSEAAKGKPAILLFKWNPKAEQPPSNIASQ